MKPLYSTPIAFVPMKEEPDAVISATEVYVGDDLVTPPYLPGEKCYVPEAWVSHDRSKFKNYLIFQSGQTWIKYKADGVDTYDTGEKIKWRSPVTMPMKAARRFVTILSCEPVKIEDARIFGEEHNLVCPRCENEGEIQDPAFTYIAFMLCPECKCTYRPLFIADWHKRHPGKSWAWRVESQPSGITG